MVQPKFSVVFVIGDMRGAEKLEQLNRRHLHFEQHLRRDPEGAEDTTRHLCSPLTHGEGEVPVELVRDHLVRLPLGVAAAQGEHLREERVPTKLYRKYAKSQAYPDTSRVFRVENGGSGGR